MTESTENYHVSGIRSDYLREINRREDGIIVLNMTKMEIKAPPPPFEPFVNTEEEFIIKTNKIPLHYYRYLFQTVGEPWLWSSRLEWTDEKLASVVHDPNIEIFVFYSDGSPSGFIELYRKLPKEPELCFCGVMPSQVGRGIGRKMLRFAMDQVWNHSNIQVDRFWLSTGDNDHPKAMNVYKSFGFQVYGDQYQELKRDPWDLGFYKSPKR